MANKNLRTIANYAKLCGVSRQAIHDRIEKETIKTTIIDDVLFIDTLKYPPQKLKNSGLKASN